MVIMQTRLDIDKDKKRFRVNVDLLKREDANDDEYRLAQAMEHILLGVLKKITEENGLTFDKQFVGEDDPFAEPDTPAQP